MNKELQIYTNNDINKNNLQLILDVIDKQGHSGFSINYVIDVIKNNITLERLEEFKKAQNGEKFGELICNDLIALKELTDELHITERERVCLVNLLQHKPLTPLTFEDDEWNLVDSFGFYQNNRCSAIFKYSKDVTPHYNNAMIIEEVDQNGDIYSFTTGRITEEETGIVYNTGGYIDDKSKTLDLPTIFVRASRSSEGDVIVPKSELDKFREHYILKEYKKD